MTHDEVQQWLEAYISAWASNDADEIGALFTDDAVYSYRPWENDKVTVRGRDAIVAAWQDQEDETGGWDAHYEPYAVENDKAVAVGWSRYHADEEDPEKTYHNAFLLRFDEGGRCSSFHEFWFLEK